MAKLSIDQIHLEGKTVLIRVDFNVPLDDKQNVRDDFRIRAALPTINKVINSGGRAVLCSHLGRPKGKRVAEMSLRPVAEKLGKLTGGQVKFTDDCIGSVADVAKQDLKNGEILLLENLRFHAEEEQNDPEFAKALAKNCDVYVNDAFGSAHRAHASTEGVTRYFAQSAAGYLMQKELEYLGCYHQFNG